CFVAAGCRRRIKFGARKLLSQQLAQEAVIVDDQYANFSVHDLFVSLPYPAWERELSSQILGILQSLCYSSGARRGIQRRKRLPSPSFDSTLMAAPSDYARADQFAGPRLYA